ncbi:MAG: DUF192 domain-containing protein [Verrucomicrobiae bacterium]|nr:DUF192 domain-containing protein [Verrucomicrobiae bacterium]
MGDGVLRAVDATRGGAVLGDRILLAATPWARMRGLLGRPGLGPGEGLWIRPTNAIHMFFMRFAIDALFLSRDLEVVGMARELAPWRMAGPVWLARSVLELPAGTLARAGCEIGDRIEIGPR